MKTCRVVDSQFNRCWIPSRSRKYFLGSLWRFLAKINHSCVDKSLFGLQWLMHQRKTNIFLVCIFENCSKFVKRLGSNYSFHLYFCNLQCQLPAIPSCRLRKCSWTCHYEISFPDLFSGHMGKIQVKHWPRYVLCVIKLSVIVSGDDQRVGHEQLPQSIWHYEYLALLLNYNNYK